MNILGGNIKNFFTNRNLILKHDLSLYFDETDKKTNKKHRVYRDISTDTFVEIFLKDSFDRYNFLDYTFHKINTDIQININKYLTEVNQMPLNGKEKIVLIFKGGNIMHEFGIKKLDDFNVYNNINILNVENKYNIQIENKYSTLQDIYNNIKSNLKVSDVDYTIMIITKTYARYNLLHDKILKIVSKSLNEISLFFDKLIDGKMNIRTNRNIYNEKVNNRILFNLISLNDRLKIKIHNDNIRNNQDYNDLDTIIKLYTNNKINDVSSLSYLYQNIELYNCTKNNIGDKNISKKFLYVIKKTINAKIKLREQILINSEFYNANKINNFIQKLENNINNKNLLNEKFYEIKSDGFNKEIINYELKKQLNQGDIKISGRSDFVVSSNTSVTDLYNKFSFGDKRKHYITYNNVIKNQLQAGTYIVDFDLMRTKFNVELDNCITVDGNYKTVNIPSEFIDISIPKYGSSNLINSHNLENHYIYQELKEKKNNITKIVNINTYTIKEIYLDLIVVLFEQNYFCPWVDIKYEKRIIRVIYFLYLYCENNNNDMKIFRDLIELSNNALNVLNSKSITELKKINDKFLISSHNILQQIHKILDSEPSDSYPLYQNYVKKKYDIIKYIVSNILFFCNLNIFRDKKFINVINKIRKYYNFVPVKNNIQQFRLDNIEALKKMLKIISDIGHSLYFTYQEINHNIIYGGNNDNIDHKYYTDMHEYINNEKKNSFNYFIDELYNNNDNKLLNINTDLYNQSIISDDNNTIDYYELINTISRTEFDKHSNDIDTVVYNNNNSDFTLTQTNINIQNNIPLQEKYLSSFSHDFKN